MLADRLKRRKTVRRELEEIVQTYKRALLQKGWDLAALALHLDGRIHRATMYKFFQGKRHPSAKTVRVVGEALGVNEEKIREAETLVRKFNSEVRSKAVRPGKGKVPTFQSIDERLKKAYNFFQLGTKELENIDNDVATILDDISERIRTTSTLSDHLRNLLKH